jgi:hypothetical protein
LARRTTEGAARRVIQETVRQAERVKQLLRELGDLDASVPLSRRFERTRRRIESGAPDRRTADTFGELTLAVHELNRLIAESFYPGSIEEGREKK